MAGEPTTTVIGNLTADPELRFIQNGKAVSNFTVASTPRSYNRDRNEWVDGDALFMRCSVWGAVAENVAESLKRGDRVVVTGLLKQKNWEKDGQKRSSVELEVDEVGPSLKWATARVTRTTSGSSNSGGSSTRSSAPSNDPWGNDDELPPF